MVDLPFRKMHGLGNDFVVIDHRLSNRLLTPDVARHLADRRLGVGCDQVIEIVASATPDADVGMKIFNADGDEVEACGNGTRCVAALLSRESDRSAVMVQTTAGLLACDIGSDGAVTVDMGPARLDWQQIPVREACDTAAMPVAAGPLSTPVGVNVGNPHAVFFVDDAEIVDLERYGPQLETDTFFPARANIEVVSPNGTDRVRMRVWERGVGITRACGTGACATAVAAARRGLTGRSVTVDLDGGPLSIHWRESDGHVLMTGPTAHVFDGVIGIDP